LQFCVFSYLTVTCTLFGIVSCSVRKLRKPCVCNTYLRKFEPLWYFWNFKITEVGLSLNLLLTGLISTWLRSSLFLFHKVDVLVERTLLTFALHVIGNKSGVHGFGCSWWVGSKVKTSHSEWSFCACVVLSKVF